MKTWWRMVILVASTIVPSLAFAAPSAIDYRIRRLSPGDRYEVTLRFDGDRSGRSTLTIPTSWASAAHAERGIEGLEVMTGQARLEDTDQPQVKRIVHRPGATVVVRYRLKQIAAGDPSATDPAAMFLPVIRPRYFAWVGWTSWVIPMADNERRVRVRVAFSGLPADWEFASSFGLDAGAIAYDGPMYAFQAAYFIGGDFRLRSRPARGGPIITAIRGDWSFTDNAFADRVATVIDGERAFWRDDSQRYYMVTLMPLDAPPGFKQSAGTGLTQGFMTQVTKDLPLDQLDFLWTHEYFHTWNNRALGRFPEPQAQLYWFSEGFTDYYMNLLQLRLGLQSLDQYARAYDEAIASLAESPEGHAPNSEVVKRFFSDGDTIGRLPYRRGMLLAAQWDAQIRATSAGRHSLDDAMRTLRDEHRHGVAVLDAARIVRVMRSYGVTDPETDIASQIERGDTARLADGTLTSCITIDEASTPRVDIGFDLRGSTQGGGPVVGVDPDGPAYAAGLRNGQFLRTFVSIDRQEHLVEAGYEETPDGNIKTVRYHALGRPVTRQRIAVRADLDDESRQRCLKTLALR
jgi:predicted metalloprotease with PDZ domain